ncbi:hypothetical protein KJS94_06175 [Flavihumibacter rivuli]|uniref:hypothetical protein n=1 Tax=Flavihumibacter rivuli TaxID=2838156 RepID=UPI001BDE9DE0|nr:hypothetical protein [Flavihumibacter rivuli]ULQ57783.1 hypothetical protein KJS94_06175 [Flavihumibacter rivuli]
MRTRHLTAVLLSTSFIFIGLVISAQKSKTPPLDSTLEANSEKWKVKMHKGFGLGKPSFGPYVTLDVEKTDSPVFRKRTKEGSYRGAIISSESWDWDFSKYEATETKKAYRMMVAAESDTTELLFSLYSVSHDKQLTFFGEMMSKDDEGKNLTLGYKKTASGIIAIGTDSISWRFLIEDSFSRKDVPQGYFNDSKRLTTAYIITGSDSLFAEPIMQQIGKEVEKYSFQYQKGIFINDSKGTHLAALKSGTAGDLSNPFYVWIRKDVQAADQQAIASLFVLLMMIKSS